MSQTFKDPYHYLCHVMQKSRDATKAPSEADQLREEFDRKLKETEQVVLDAMKNNGAPGAA
ncbi:hypothetical protein [Stutzerimonas stutzeri]|jgi:hypothetical protein|uniref:Uncharacterized protein n=1 Tax=Stutzerimonas stutzeri TaxID=316 RepID=A0A2N8SNB0_STUST|nr:hypothetical protein [Stutzerimonas stutzeri]EQM76407.1 hypothetical protein L686_17185 [Stutzerimonas stutzeri MF28]MCQ4250100.1 hypothetical protein [Stutzerimonas stutzeri]PNG03974.1 hypothetical protein CXL00_17475 [Stutzerimonas stutzeri]UVO17102.1 hypothetical protein KN217_14575 [Stutzerimonas stutzeri]